MAARSSTICRRPVLLAFPSAARRHSLPQHADLIRDKTTSDWVPGMRTSDPCRDLFPQPLGLFSSAWTRWRVCGRRGENPPKKTCNLTVRVSRKTSPSHTLPHPPTSSPHPLAHPPMDYEVLKQNRDSFRSIRELLGPASVTSATVAPGPSR